MGLSERVSDPAAPGRRAATSRRAHPARGGAQADREALPRVRNSGRDAQDPDRGPDLPGRCEFTRRSKRRFFYPAARDVLAQRDGDLIDDTAPSTRASRFSSGASSRPARRRTYDALVRVLADYVKYHVAEEERELFPRLRGMEIDLLTIGEALAKGSASSSPAAADRELHPPRDAPGCRLGPCPGQIPRRRCSSARGSTMADRRDIDVVPQRRDWAVRKEGSSRASRISHEGTRARDARLVAKRNKVELVVHRQDGMIQDADSYGSDPNPPADRVP